VRPDSNLATNGKWTPAAEQASSRIEVDLDEADSSKAIARIRDEPANGKASDESDELTPTEQRRLDKKAFSKRFSRIERNFEQRLADQEARHQQELATIRQRGVGVQATRVAAADDAAHEREIEALQAQIELAVEKGESKEVARLTRVMAQKEAQHWAKKEAAVRGEPVQTAAPAQKQAAAPAEQSRGQTAAAKTWLRENQEWFKDEDHRIETQAALVIDEDLRDEGYDAESPEYFAELNTRLKKRFPELEVIGDTRKGKRAAREQEEVEDEPTTRRALARPPVQSFEDRGAAPRRQAGRRVTLTTEQISTMRAVGMDPDNDKHVAIYAREIQSSEADE
jgi:hypothetical protein